MVAILECVAVATQKTDVFFVYIDVEKPAVRPVPLPRDPRHTPSRGTVTVTLFTNLGIEPRERRLVVVKSSQHFYASFASIASRIVYLDCPGSLQLDLRRYDYQQVQRPRWPLDDPPPRPWQVVPQIRG